MSQATTAKACEVVLVEDLREHADTLTIILELEGHSVCAASNGQDGFTLIVDRKPRVAFIDLGLPQLDGYQIAQRVRQAGMNTYLVALTGYGDDKVKMQCVEAGFDRHIGKPLQMHDLRDVMERALVRAQGPRER